MCTFLYEYKCYINCVVARPYSKMCVAPSLDLCLQRRLLILIEDFGNLCGAIKIKEADTPARCFLCRTWSLL